MDQPGTLTDLHTKESTDGCFSPDFSEFCSFFSSEDGKPVCTKGVKVDQNIHGVMATNSSLAMCDATLPSCSASGFACHGKAQPCSPEFPAYDCPCWPRVGFVSCDFSYKQRMSRLS